jgi:hypothetical protein
LTNQHTARIQEGAVSGPPPLLLRRQKDGESKIIKIAGSTDKKETQDH